MAFIFYHEKPAVTPIVTNLQLVCPPHNPPQSEDLHFDCFSTVYNDKHNFI